MPNPQNRNDRRKGEERSETLIIPHITKEMLETARRMAEEGASRAEIEKAISAMQSPAQPASSPASRPAQHAAPAPQPMAAPPERKHRIIPTSRPRLSAEERAALRQQMQMGETQAETPQPEPEQEALRQEAARRGQPPCLVWPPPDGAKRLAGSSPPRRPGPGRCPARSGGPGRSKSGRAYRYPHHCHPKTAYCILPGGTCPRSHPRNVCGPAAAHSGRTCPAVCRLH